MEPTSEPTASTAVKKDKNSSLGMYVAFGIIGAVIIAIVAIILINAAKNTTTASLDFNSANWSYDADNNVYYQIGNYYVSKPVSETYETFGIYVPGDYLNCEQGSDDKYTCEVNQSSEVNGYTASTAPVVMPVNTPGYSAQQAPTSYSYKTISSYIENGLIYLHAGCRGRISSGGPNKSSETTSVDFETGAPWGVTDLKAAVRYLRYNQDKIPGDKDQIYAFGHSGGGAQSAILGASGDSTLYDPYLEEIGAAMYYQGGTKISDAIAGVNAWCPITELIIADAAYEWNMGQYANSNTRADGTWTSALSDDLAADFAEYINHANFTDENGTKLTLTETTNGIYTSGTYYNYVKSVIEESLNNYLQDNYDTNTERASYVASLGDWASFESGKATITSIGDFVKSQKSATKSVPAFDDLNLSQAENAVFADSNNNPQHFNSAVGSLIGRNDYGEYDDYDTSYLEAYKEQLVDANVDRQGNTLNGRLFMYTPTFYLTDQYAMQDDPNFNAATPAKHWRIRTGITQGDTALTTEINLNLALKANEVVEDVDFATVWGKGHTEAERTGSATTNFIDWVELCTK